METTLTAFLAPFMPYLMERATRSAEKAIDAFGAEAWKCARAIWARLRPTVEKKEAALEAAHALSESPDDEPARGALQFHLRRLLEADSELAAQIGDILNEARSAGVMATNGSVIIHGDIKADRGGISAGRDIHGGRGGIRTGGGEKDDE